MAPLGKRPRCLEAAPPYGPGSPFCRGWWLVVLTLALALSLHLTRNNYRLPPHYLLSSSIISIAISEPRGGGDMNGECTE